MIGGGSYALDEVNKRVNMGQINFFGDDEVLSNPSLYSSWDYVGNGGMATVYRVEEDTVVKLTEITKVPFLEDEEMREVQFHHHGCGLTTIDNNPYRMDINGYKKLKLCIREQRIMQELTGINNLVQIKGQKYISSHQGSLSSLLEMEYVEGQTLDEWIYSGLKLPDAAKAIVDIGEALSYLAARKIIHRDIKHNNIIYKEGQSLGEGKATLIDFGLSKKKGEVDFMRKNAVMGTPGFLSPEQARADNLTPAADIFSLARTAFRLYSGEDIFPLNYILGDEESAKMEVVQTGGFSSADLERAKERLWSKGLPSDLVDAFDKAMQPDPQERVLEPLIEESYKLAKGGPDVLVIDIALEDIENSASSLRSDSLDCSESFDSVEAYTS